MPGNSILKSYAVWLRNQGIKSVNVFTSGISKVNEESFMPVRQKDMFEILPDAIRSQEAVDWLTSLESFINLAFEKTVVRQDKDEFGNGIGPIREILDLTEKKKLENRRNCLRKFIEYVAFLQENLNEDEIYPSLNSSVTFLSKESLKDIPVYCSCIAEGSELFFLPTVLEKYFKFFSREEVYLIVKKKKLYWGDNREITPMERYKEWKENIFRKARVYTPKKIMPFNQIDGLLLEKESRKVMVVNKGHKHELISIPSGKPYRINPKFTPRIEASKPIGEILQKHASVFPTMKLLTDMIHDVVRDAVVEIEDKNGVKKTIRLDKYRDNDFLHLKRYILQKLPVHKVMVLMPHLLMELYQLNEYVSPRLIVK